MTDLDEHRLPSSIAPTAYDLVLAVDLDGARFDGEVTITLDVREATRVIECHASELEIGEVRVSTGDRIESVAEVRTDEERQRLTIELDRELAVGSSELSVHFSGVLNDRLVGFYRSTYSDEDGTHTLAVSQFEAPYARLCFPCWDEPSAKATFRVTLVVDDDLLAISNSAEVSRDPAGAGRVAVHFAETMPMSTYLVAFVVGRLDATEPVDVDGTPVRVVHRPGQGHLCQAAVEAAAHSLRWFSEYYAIPYPGDKLDLVAVPDFAFGAMENLGCVTFREILLLLDVDALTQPELERAVTVIAHEIAHMWFGDLVTMAWWDGIWLNEAFATFMELSCADAYRPEWGVWQSFGLGRSSAFDADAVAATRPIHYEVRTPEDAEGMFDVLTYEKGAAVLRMIEQFLGPEVFRAGVRRYLARHSYGNTEITDLWDDLDAVTDAPVRAVMDSWILQGGHPVVRATATDAGLRLDQQRFGYVGGDPLEPTTWSVPVRLRAIVDGETVERRVLLDRSTLDVDLGGGPEWVWLNTEATGFHRTIHDGALGGAVLDRLDLLDAAERFSLVDDTWALTLAGDIDLADVATVLRANATESDPSALRRIAGVLGTLSQLGGAAHSTTVSAFVAELLERRGHRHDEPEVEGILLRIAGTIADQPEAVTRSREILRQLATTPGSAHPELVAAAIDVTATHGGADEFEQFVEGYRRAESPQQEQRYLAALTRFRDPELFDRLLQLCLSEVRTQNAPYTLAQAMGNPANGDRAWELVSNEWDVVSSRFPSNSIVRLAGGIRTLFDPAVAADVLSFFAAHPIPQGERTLAQHLEIVRVHQALRSREYDRLADSLR